MVGPVSRVRAATLDLEAQAILAYRVISIDYQDLGFSYDVENSGPNLGLVFRF